MPDGHLRVTEVVPQLAGAQVQPGGELGYVPAYGGFEMREVDPQASYVEAGDFRVLVGLADGPVHGINPNG
jgi:hypothetical protein